MHRVILGVGHGTDAQVGGRASLDDRAERGQAAKREVLPPAHCFEARGIVCAANERIAGPSRKAAALLYQSLGIDRDAEFFQCGLVVQIIGDLGQAFANPLLLVGLGPAGPRQSPGRAQERCNAPSGAHPTLRLRGTSAPRFRAICRSTLRPRDRLRRGRAPDATRCRGAGGGRRRECSRVGIPLQNDRSRGRRPWGSNPRFRRAGVGLVDSIRAVPSAAG